MKFLLQTALAPWACLSVVLIYFSLLLLLSDTQATKKPLLTQLPDIKVAQFYFERNFSKKCHFQIISDVQWWTKKFHPFLHSTNQEWMIFARIGDGSCYYLWNEICAGVARKCRTSRSQHVKTQVYLTDHLMITIIKRKRSRAHFNRERSKQILGRTTRWSDNHQLWKIDFWKDNMYLIMQ